MIAVLIAVLIAEGVTSSGCLKFGADVARAIRGINDKGPMALCLGSV